MKKLNHDGFHVLITLIVVMVVATIGFASYRVISNQKDNNNAKSAEVVWAFDESKLRWYAKSGTPSTCNDPFVFEKSPVDLSKIMVIGMPGGYRGNDYKPHGGLRLIDPESGKINIVMPTDATLVSLRRYYEGDPADLQYLLTFETDCGIAFRFDHLYELTPEFQKIAETTPEPKKDDTRTDPNQSFARTKFNAGDVVATAVGAPKIKNFGFDFGTYDYRHTNTISSNKKWATLHGQYQSLDWFGTCWINQLPSSDLAKGKELALTIINPAKPDLVSDYCDFAPKQTLDINNGQPVNY